MDDVKIIATKALDSASSAHKRLDELGGEVKGLRTKSHDLNGKVHNHGGILSSITSSVALLSATVEENTKQLISFKAMVVVVIFMGTGFFGFCVFVAGKLLNWF
jgi:hypothetical protein